MSWLALDIGGANLKAADGLSYAASQSFELWRAPHQLAEALAAMMAAAPSFARLAVTMTGELADCYATKANGVRHILECVESAAAGRDIRVYTTDGRFVVTAAAREQPLAVAAANWHALAAFAARYVEGEPGMLIDIGSTTCDLIPIVDGRPAATGRTDTERLIEGELVYTGVERSPVCAVAAALPWRGRQCATAQEVFATTLDAYLLLGALPESPDSLATADGRPATRAAARERLARSICADRTTFDDHDAREAAEAIARLQTAKIGVAAQALVRRMAAPPRTVVVSGSGEFLARDVVRRLRIDCRIVSLAETLGSDLSRVATAHAVAVLARQGAEA